MKKKIKTLYLLSPKIKWKTFKILQDKFVKDTGPTPIHGAKILWEMLKEKKIYCWFCDEMPNDMGIGLQPPSAKEVKIIS
jgi:hypothetical protein